MIFENRLQLCSTWNISSLIISPNPLLSRFNNSPSSRFFSFCGFFAFSLPLVDSLQNGAFVLLSLAGVF